MDISWTIGLSNAVFNLPLDRSQMADIFKEGFGWTIKDGAV
jgi:hypothetical protein